MFKDNKYTRKYYQLIERARENIPEVYEEHHIIPRCLGGDDNTENLVRLSYRQHYVAHVLLTKMHDSKKLINALWQMSFMNKKKHFNSRMYDYAKTLYVESISGENHWAKSAEFRKRVSESWTAERKASFKQKVCGKKHWTAGRDMSRASEIMRRGIDQEKARESARHLFTTRNPMKLPEIAAKHKKPKERVTCPYCKKIGGKPVMMRYHFENCKEK